MNEYIQKYYQLLIENQRIQIEYPVADRILHKVRITSTKKSSKFRFYVIHS